jgi:hypothetical protein
MKGELDPMVDQATELVVLRAMFAKLSPETLETLEQALAIALTPVPTASERTWATLGSLAEMLKERFPEGRTARALPRVPREEYDAERAPGAPSSAALVTRFGAWSETLGAAAGLLGWDSGRRAWANPTRGRRRPPDYSRAEVVAGVLHCGERITRLGLDGVVRDGVPSSSAYLKWVNRERARLRQLGAEPPRLALYQTIRRLFPGGWAEVRAEALRTLRAREST